MDIKKIIINNFALYYRVRLFGKTISFVRSANIIYPLFLITGYVGIFHENYIELPLFLLLVSIIIGFGYFTIKSIEYDDYQKLTKSQKYQYNIFYKYHIDDNKEVFDNVWCLLLNPILTILFLILYFSH